MLQPTVKRRLLVKNKTNPKLQKVIKKKKKKKGGCLRCFGIALLSIVLIFVSALTALYFVADGYLKSNFGLSMADCFSLIGGIYKVDESKVVTEGNPTDADKTAFYEELSNCTFIKASAIDDVVGTAISEAIIPALSNLSSEPAKTSSANLSKPVLKEGNDESAFDWESYLIEMVEEGVIDREKVQSFCSSNDSIENLYEDQFVIDVTGKGMIAFVDSIVNATLDGVDGLGDYKGKFGIRQIKFGVSESEVKTMNLVLQVKPKDLAGLTVDQLITSEDGSLSQIQQNKWLIDTAISLLPENVFFGMNINLNEDSATIEPYINNISYQDLGIWFNAIKIISGVDIKETLNLMATDVLNELKSSTNGMVDLYAMISQGALQLDLYDLASGLLNESLELEGEDSLSKYETAETIANVFYANMEVNGNGREEILTSQAPKFLSENWKDTARSNFKQWLETNIAFDGTKTVDDFIKEFEDEEGKFNAPGSMAKIFNYLDTEYMKQGLAFLKNPLGIDDTYIAYLFDDYKSMFLSGGGMIEYLDKINLEYVRIDEEGTGASKHVYLMLGISISTDDMLSLAGFDGAGFITSIIGNEIFVCAKADITKGISDRESTRFMLNGLSESKTGHILTTVSKIAKQDIISEFIDTYVDDFISELEIFGNDFFEIEFTESNGDGTVLLPSASKMIEKILASNEGKEIDGDALVDALSDLLTSNYEYPWYTASIQQSSNTLTGNEFTYDDYYSLVKAQFYAHYMMKTGNDALTIEQFVDKISDILSSPDALSVIMGKNEDERLFSFTKTYFENKTTIEQTRPVIDGHTLAYLMNESDGEFTEIIGSEKIDLFDAVDIRDIEIRDGFMTIYMQAIVDEFLDLQDESLAEYENFLKRLLGGEGETMAVSLKIFIGNSLPAGEKEVEANLANLSKDKMNTIFDAFETFGVTTFKFENDDGSVNEDNEIVQMGREIAKFFDKDCTIEGDKIIFKSLFTIMSEEVIKKQGITDEKLFFAISDFVCSENANVSYDNGESFASSYTTLTGTAFNATDYDNTNKQYAQYGALINDTVEAKYMLKDTKNVGDMISAVSKTGNEMSDAMLGSDKKDGLIDTNRTSMATYFNGVGATYLDTIPALDGHTLAYVVDKYKQSIKDMAKLEDSDSTTFDKVEVLDIQTVSESGVDYVVLYVKVDIAQLMEEMNDGEDDIRTIFELFEDGTKNVTVEIKKALNADEKVQVTLNDMNDSELDNLSDLLEAYGVNYFNNENEDSVFSNIANALKDMINDYMPYNRESGKFVLDSAFDYIGKEVQTATGGNLSGKETYTLVKAFTIYGTIVPNKVDATEEFDSKTSEYYYLTNGTNTVNGIINGDSDENSLTFRNNEYYELMGKTLSTREIIIEDNVGWKCKTCGYVYKKEKEPIEPTPCTHSKDNYEELTKKYATSFNIEEKFLAGLVDSLEISSMSDMYSLDQIVVVKDNYIRAYAIINDVEKFVSTTKLDSLSKFDVLPKSLKVSIPVAFEGNKDEGDNWKIEGMDDESTGDVDEFAEVKKILTLLGIDLDDEIKDREKEMKNSVGRTLADYEMKFEVGKGLKMPSLVSLIKKMRNDTIKDEARKEGEMYLDKDLLTDEEVKYLFDNFVCYQVHDYHLGEYDELLAHDDFMEIMNENYRIGTKVMLEKGIETDENKKDWWPYLYYISSDLERDDEPCVYVKNSAVDKIANGTIEPTDCISYWELMYALDLIGFEKLKEETIKDGIKTYENVFDDPNIGKMLGDMIDWQAIGQEIMYNFGVLGTPKPDVVHTDDFILNERVSSTLFFDSATWSEDTDGDGVIDEGFDFEFMRAPVNDWVIVRGAVNISNKFSLMGKSFVSLMPEVITIEVIQDLKGNGIGSDPHDPEWGDIVTKDSNGDGKGDGFGCEIYDLPISNKQGLREGDYAHRQANTEKLIDIFEKFGADMGDVFKEESKEEETFSERIKDSVNTLFASLDGKEEITSPDEEIKEARTVKNVEGRAVIEDAQKDDVKHIVDSNGDDELSDEEIMAYLNSDDGIIVPSLIHYLNANWIKISMPTELKNLFYIASGMSPIYE